MFQRRKALTQVQAIVTVVIVAAAGVGAYLLGLIPGVTSPLNKGSPAIRFAVIGDYGTNNDVELAVSKLVKSWNPDFIIALGDNRVYGNWSTTISKYYDVSPSKFYPCIGNHDLDDDGGVSEYLAYFTLPGNERYYDFTKGPVHFYSVNCINDPDGVSNSSKQAMWLKGRLSSSNSSWDIVYFHQPPYTSISPLLLSPNNDMRWSFKSWGADVVLSGHVHAYERLSVGGLTYLTLLSGGQSPFRFGTSVSGSLFRYSDSNGATLVTATNTQLDFKTYTVSGSLVEDYVMNK